MSGSPDNSIVTAHEAKKEDINKEKGEFIDVERPTVAGEDHEGLGASAKGASIEDCMYYADQQYFDNHQSSVQTIEAHGILSDNVDKNVHAVVEDEKPAGEQIRKSPLWYIWGPKSPAYAHPEKRQSDDLTHQTNDAEIGVEHIDLGAQNNRDTYDRLILRKVTMLRAFFLITTDVLGAYQGPYVFGQVGYVPGTVLYVVLGVMAFLGGVIINVLYLRLDSDKMPIRNYSYLVQRVWGNVGKAIVDFFFSIQLIFQCGLIMLTNAQNIGLIVDGAHTNPDGTPRNHLCFTVMVLVFMVINILFSPIRSLRTISFFSMVSLLTAIIICVIATIIIYQNPPNYAQALATAGTPKGPVEAVAFVSQPLEVKVNGIMNLVYAYGGAQIFIDVFAEMRRPWDFWKSYAIAQSVIMFFYLVFGLLIYARQGQFVQSLLYYGISSYAWQTVGNAISTYTALISSVLYGNIVQKEIYYLVVRGIFKGPALMTRQGFVFWMIGNVFIWALAFIIASAIPQVASVSGIIAAISILQFSYSFPFLLKFSFDVQVDAMKGDAPYVHSSALGSHAHRADTWRQWSRWRRGLFSGNVLSKAFFLIIGLGSVSMAGLGIYGSAESIVETFKVAKATSFGCATP